MGLFAPLSNPSGHLAQLTISALGFVLEILDTNETNYYKSNVQDSSLELADHETVHIYSKKINKESRFRLKMLSSSDQLSLNTITVMCTWLQIHILLTI